jgi:hypothetical protein
MPRPAPRRLVLICLIALILPLAHIARGQEDSKTRKPRMKPAPEAAAQTQTGPTKPQTQTGPAGVHHITGFVVLVKPERKSVVIQSANSQFEVFVGPKCKVTRDEAAVTSKDVKVGDRVDECIHNAKRVCQVLRLTSGEKARSIPVREK